MPMKKLEEFPFPLPLAKNEGNKKDFIQAITDVAEAIHVRGGRITDYYEQKLDNGGKAGVIEVEVPA